MSRSTLYKVYKTRARGFAEFSNSWGSGAALWSHLCDHFLGGKTWLGADNKDLWALARNSHVPEYLRIAHAFTFDGAFCPPDKIPVLVAALRATNEAIAVKYWSHFGAFADALAAAKLDKRCLGVALNCTSVCDIWEEYDGSRKLFDCVEYALGAHAPETIP